MKETMTQEYLTKMLTQLNECKIEDRQMHSSLALLKYIFDETKDKAIVKLFKDINNIQEELYWEEV